MFLPCHRRKKSKCVSVLALARANVTCTRCCVSDSSWTAPTTSIGVGMWRNIVTPSCHSSGRRTIMCWWPMLRIWKCRLSPYGACKGSAMVANPFCFWGSLKGKGIKHFSSGSRFSAEILALCMWRWWVRSASRAWRVT
ncbi:hypothetical protein [Cynomolgus macaque cytomegalovirus strain Mauritius]|uniref:Uncharacterized protein n=1 Tax=Cynomolgus macaque cytomegalovirus strain Mauritius TaxID=1690255 RepID=A0A0K1H0M0_9BETA|nr:hypothetical protein [Cynomolgus macaque cytomegalovirus strain Mauritius]